MLPALLTVALWTLSSLFSGRAAVQLGGMRVNRWRLLIAALLVGTWTHATTGAAVGPALWWLVASGALGLGLGDVAMFVAYERLGVRLTVLLNQCLAVPLTVLASWALRGERLGIGELLLAAVILAGVALALAPGARLPTAAPEAAAATAPRRRSLGVLCCVLAATGTALGAVLTRTGYDAAEAAGIDLRHPQGGIVATWLRVLGALTACWLLVGIRRLGGAVEPPLPAASWRAGLPTLLATGIIGPALGVACFQWALAVERAGVVQAVVATTPVAVMFLTWAVDRDRPTISSAVGGVIAVAAAVGMALIR